jgi:orotidine-5'-phosphate decarboxylase
VLVDENGKSANDGLLLSWDRTMSEISDKLCVAVDYQSGKSALGSLNFGVSWAFSKNVSVIFGYDIYNNVQTGGKNTFTTQLDINFP